MHPKCTRGYRRIPCEHSNSCWESQSSTAPERKVSDGFKASGFCLWLEDAPMCSLVSMTPSGKSLQGFPWGKTLRSPLIAKCPSATPPHAALRGAGNSHGWGEHLGHSCSLGVFEHRRTAKSQPSTRQMKTASRESTEPCASAPTPRSHATGGGRHHPYHTEANVAPTRATDRSPCCKLPVFSFSGTGGIYFLCHFGGCLPCQRLFCRVKRDKKVVSRRFGGGREDCLVRERGLLRAAGGHTHAWAAGGGAAKSSLLLEAPRMLPYSPHPAPGQHPECTVQNQCLPSAARRGEREGWKVLPHPGNATAKPFLGVCTAYTFSMQFLDAFHRR